MEPLSLSETLPLLTGKVCYFIKTSAPVNDVNAPLVPRWVEGCG